MIVIKRFATYTEANHMLQGGIVGCEFKGPFEGLVGKTLTFTSPAGTKTFTQPAGSQVGQMSFKDIKTQLEGAIANLRVVAIDNKIAFIHKTAGSAITLGSADEPARSILGLPNNVAINGQCVNGPGGTAPKFIEHVTENGAVSVAIEV